MGFSYLVGISTNGLTLWFFELFFSGITGMKAVNRNYKILKSRTKTLKELGIYLPANNKVDEDMGKNIIEILSPYVKDLSDSAKSEFQYLRRLHRMARSGLMGIIFWLLIILFSFQFPSYGFGGIYKLVFMERLLIIVLCFIFIIGLIMGIYNHSRLLADRTIYSFLSLTSPSYLKTYSKIKPQKSINDKKGEI